MGEALPPISAGALQPDPPHDARHAPGPLLVRTPTDGGRPSARVAGIVGSAAATVVRRARHLPQRVQQLKNQVVAGHSQEGRDASEWAEQSQHRARELRSLAGRYSHRNPLMTVAFAGLGGLALGFSLRFWRDRRG